MTAPATRTSRMVQEAVQLSNFDMPKYVKLASTKGAINLSQGAPNYDGSKAARDAVAKLMGSEGSPALHQYSPTRGHPKLVTSIQNYYQRIANWKLGENEIAVTTSGSEAIFAICQAFINPGDEVIYFEPFFPWYARSVKFAGGVNVAVKLQQTKEGLRPDFKALEKSITKKTKAILWNTPHNPSGFVASKEETEALCDICKKHDLLLISDEVYEAHVFPSSKKTHVRPAMLEGMHERTLTMGSASKLFSLTGWRVGWVIGPEKLLKPIDMVHGTMSFCAPTPLQLGVAAAFDEQKGTEEDEIATLLEKNYTELSKACTKLGLKPLLAEGGHFLAVDVSPLGKTGAEFTDDLAAGGVIALPMNWFALSKDANQFQVRFALCKKASDVAEAVKRLGKLKLEKSYKPSAEDI